MIQIQILKNVEVKNILQDQGSNLFAGNSSTFTCGILLCDNGNQMVDALLVVKDVLKNIYHNIL